MNKYDFFFFYMCAFFFLGGVSLLLTPCNFGPCPSNAFCDYVCYQPAIGVVIMALSVVLWIKGDC